MRRNLRTPLFVAVVLLAVVLPAAVRFYTDWLWFGDTGYQDVYATTLVARGEIGSAGLALAFGVLLLNIRIALRALWIRTLVLTTREGPVAVTVDRRSVQAISTAFATVMALLCGLYASGQWQEWLMFRHAQPFGEVDPVLGNDISFYIFRLPFLDLLR